MSSFRTARSPRSARGSALPTAPRCGRCGATSWSPGSWTCTSTCESRATKTSRRSRAAPGPPRRAGSPPGAPCRTPIPSPTTRRRSASSCASRCVPAGGGAVGIPPPEPRGFGPPPDVPRHPSALADAEGGGNERPEKSAPPLREAADVAALRAALKEGVIDCIASDHAPHAYDAKEAAFDDAPFGIVGLETAFAVAYTELVAGGVLGLPSWFTG